jgi:hypothetical protein
MELTPLERAALRALGNAYEPEFPGLLAQLAIAKPSKRENTGGGFFTDIEVDRKAAAPLSGRSPIDNHFTDIEGMIYPLGLLLFHEDGFVCLLEGYAVGGDDTSAIDFTSVGFSPLRITT